MSDERVAVTLYMNPTTGGLFLTPDGKVLTARLDSDDREEVERLDQQGGEVVAAIGEPVAILLAGLGYSASDLLTLKAQDII